MRSPYGMEIAESCLTCKMRADRIFCDLSPAALQSFENIKYAMSYPQRSCIVCRRAGAAGHIRALQRQCEALCQRHKGQDHHCDNC